MTVMPGMSRLFLDYCAGAAAAQAFFASAAQPETNHFRPPVHPRRNVEDFPAVTAKFVRFRVFKTNVREPCLDELEIYPEGELARNVALASRMADASNAVSL